MLFAKAVLIFDVCFVVRNNSCGNSSSSKFFLFNLNIVAALFFAADFNFSNCVYLLVEISLLDNLTSFIILLHLLEKILISFFNFF